MTIRYLVTAVLVVALSACGFHLRGSKQKASVEVSRIYITDRGAGTVARELKQQLDGAGARVVSEVDKASYVMEIENEFFDQRVLSVSADTGKVEEYELSLSLYFSLTDDKGNELIDREELSYVKDYTFDEDAVLGKFEEEDVLREELVGLAVDDIIRRLNAAADSK